ncbi:MAG TPA: hypothetical protein VMU42_14240, partial [Candidatus Sulfotelmatobacter sp.]|nr:hypothetical protein [Candidatus Sulfotelmatobacter sp.]
EHAAFKNLNRPMTLYWGGRRSKDLYLAELAGQWEKEIPNFRFVPVLSEPSGPTARRTGFLADVLAQDFTSLDGAKLYLAGPPIMVESCVAAAARRGVRKEDCHADAFYTEADKARLAAQ